MSTTFFISPQYKDLFKENDLVEFEDFLKIRKDYTEIISHKEGSVHFLNLNGNQFFLKIKKPERFRKVYRSIIRNFSYIAPVEKEVKNIKHLEKEGIKSVEISAWGQDKKFGIVKNSFILTPKVNGEEVYKFYPKAKYTDRIHLYKELGKLIGNLHNKNIDSLVRIQDILCEKTESAVKVNLIDREEGSTKHLVYTLEKALAELAETSYKSIKMHLKVFITHREAMCFCKSYLTSNKKIKLKPQQFYRMLIAEFLNYSKKRKSSDLVLALLPKNLKALSKV